VFECGERGCCPMDYPDSFVDIKTIESEITGAKFHVMLIGTIWNLYIAF
jgi:hypothetical protein